MMTVTMFHIDDEFSGLEEKLVIFSVSLGREGAEDKRVRSLQLHDLEESRVISDGQDRENMVT